MKKDIDKYLTILKENDVRMTSQRIAILEYLANENHHPTANEIFKYLQDDFSSMSVATVYNNLNFFKDAGILKELQFKDEPSRFDLTDTIHYHAKCIECGKIVDFDVPELKKIETKVENLTQFNIINHSYSVTGLCNDCKNDD